ncbi:flavin reductase family protein [Dokdonia sp. Hel_I_53]|uniref:flavin reductase family protein n=1 Tax=Dokdonia sp. Hel_I_53 TaxID=1566287 RepID=UPI00119C2E87|nr:flavin reductase family protein [Dokdonia sp. Hel_I_53]TVZ52103.1 flavin reductase (DIM6/NTAB) family NADH-FMN oxidoreductase RutF [Dokdonia sp. Hel_I_53]
MEKILHIDKNKISAMDKRYRANFINSVTGFKSANLLGSISTDNIENLAIFSSITHLGSDPSLLGFITRPNSAPRHTYKNIRDTGIFTVNHVNENIIKEAHQTAARYDESISEFKAAGLHTEYLHNWKAPFLKEAQIKIACEYVSEYQIKENDTVLIVAAIKGVYLPEKALNDDGWINLEITSGVSINGLDSYSKPKLIDRFSYAKPNMTPSSILKKD